MNPLWVQLRQVLVLGCLFKLIRHTSKWVSGRLEEPEPVFDTVIPTRTADALLVHSNNNHNEDGATFHLCNRTDVQFRIQPQILHNTAAAAADVVVLVLSGPHDVERRAQFRQTHVPQSSQRHNNHRMRIVFVLGETTSSHPADVQAQLELESRKHNDLLQLNHPDEYRSIYFKVLAGFVWVTRYCREAQYILKTDLGTVINLDFLSRAIDRSLSQQRNDLRIECAFPTRLVRVVRPTPYMNPNSIAGKWALSKEEMEQDVFPNYCTGFLYGVTSQAALALAEASVSVPWEQAASLSILEDAFITGFLRQSVENIEIHSMLNWWQRKLYEGLIVQCPFMTGVTTIFLNPAVKQKLSSEGVPYIQSPSYFFCALIERLLRTVDSVTEGYGTASLWNVCARDNLALSRIVVVFLVLSVLVSALLLLLCNTLVALLSWMRQVVTNVISGRRGSHLVLLAPILWTKHRTD